jgi:hypothetical protein
VSEHHARVRQTGIRERARFRALCHCKWRGPLRYTVEGAMADAKRHDPLYPQGSRPEDMP